MAIGRNNNDDVNRTGMGGSNPQENRDIRGNLNDNQSYTGSQRAGQSTDNDNFSNDRDVRGSSTGAPRRDNDLSTPTTDDEDEQ